MNVFVVFNSYGDPDGWTRFEFIGVGLTAESATKIAKDHIDLTCHNMSGTERAESFLAEKGDADLGVLGEEVRFGERANAENLTDYNLSRGYIIESVEAV